MGRGGGYWDIVTYIISQYLIPAILYRDIIYALYCPSGTLPPPPPTTAIFRNFKKSTKGLYFGKYGLMGKKYHENNAHADKKG